MKIILDDKRAFPNDTYNCVRTYEECIELLRLFRKARFLSLDYDLGSKHTGYDVLVYMHDNGITAGQINIHSDHSEGVPKMRQYVQEHFPDAALTFNSL